MSCYLYHMNWLMYLLLGSLDDKRPSFLPALPGQQPRERKTLTMSNYFGIGWALELCCLEISTDDLVIRKGNVEVKCLELVSRWMFDSCMIVFAFLEGKFLRSLLLAAATLVYHYPSSSLFFTGIFGVHLPQGVFATLREATHTNSVTAGLLILAPFPKLNFPQV